MGTNPQDFLGRGWKFPVKVDKVTGRIMTSEYEEDIKEAVGIIVRTQKGERVMNPNFGCDIQQYIFDTLDYSNLMEMKMDIERALMLYEPRIIQVKVEINTDTGEEGRIDIEISYVVRSTNNPYNLVYPYFINEGFGEW